MTNSTSMNMPLITNAFSYAGFISHVEDLVRRGRTTGPSQSEARIYFTALNLKRMQRIDKTAELGDVVRNGIVGIRSSQQWVVLTEAWCGDSAQVLPVISKMAEASGGRVNLKIILRDEHPDWIEKYHTNGSHSIPKLIAFDNCGHERFIWGPRPEPAQKMLLEWKTNEDARSWEEFERDLHTWYTRDKYQTIQAEFSKLIKRPSADCKKAVLAA